MLYDISPPITPRLAVWPGDTRPGREVLMDMARGDNVTLSTLHATVHLGAHADGPNHYGKDAPAVDERTLDYYLGPCQVIRADVARAARITFETIFFTNGA
jgi:arylformamidase